MRRHTKRRCAELIKTIEEAHAQIIKFIDANDAMHATALLGDCQDAAVAIGNLIESQEGERTEAVKLLEDYCETLYHINEDITREQSNSSKNIEKKLKKEIRQIQSSISALPTRIEAVFMPYNATMWDSLESIWMAADADENCDAYVVPIPYYDRNPDGSFAKFNYDIDKYPDYVPVINHEEFNLEEHYPDIIFIHNPYDEYNIVTSVHPKYYSQTLKHYTDCLVYVPYYATSGKMSEGQSFLPSYLNVDYIVVQTKNIIEQFDERIPREKFLPLGSPKFDRAIRLCKNPPELPKEWMGKTEGKRVYFYNTSIGEMLEDTEAFLKKMKYVFNTFKEVPDACILWRPHPLLESSFSSMREELYDEYKEIKNSFIKDEIGIYDTTPDIEVSIACCDAYLGTLGSSVISLFQMTNKPIYILDRDTTEPPPKDWWKGSIYYYPLPDKRENKYIVMPNNKLFYSKSNDGKYNYLSDLPGDNKYNCYGISYCMGEKTYLFPTNAQDILVISEDKITDRIILKRQGEAFASFNHIWVYEDYVFLIPRRYPDIVRMNLKTGSIDYVKNVANFFWRREKEDSFCGHYMDRKREKFCFLDANAENVMEIDVRTLNKTIKKVGYGQALTNSSAQNIKDTRFIWFIPIEGTKVARWDNDERTINEYDLNIPGLISKNPEKDKMEACNINYFGSIIPISEDRIVFCPLWANEFVELNPLNSLVKEWKPPFPLYTERINKYYYNWGRGYSVRGRKEGEIRWVNLPERVMYNLDLKNNKANPIKAEFDEKEIYEQYATGFKKSESTMYCLFETGWNTLKSIISDHLAGEGYNSSDARKVIRIINAECEGRCGSEIYNHMKALIMR